MLTRLRDLNVASKLFAGFGVVCLLLAVVVAIGIHRLGSSQANLEQLSTNGLASVASVGEVKDAYVSMRLELANAGMSQTAEDTDAALAKLEDADGVYEDAWAAYLASEPSTAADLREEVEEHLAEYRTAREPIIALARSGDVAGFITARAGTAELSGEITRHIDELGALEQQAAKDLAAEGSADYHTAITLLLVIGAAALAVAVVVAVAVARSIAGPLAKTLTVVRGLADGRLDQRVAITTKDEVGQLASALDATMERLSATIRAIAGGATTLATSSEELTTVATQLSSGAEEAATQAQVVSTATEEISANIATV
ncbi:HAMP domain-containing protein, partial [Kineococcus sp. T13]|uniref:Tar ligand binding domain-containing protein n=1 Tax=Kineococcus vitellinus TaxID=2696565 RepID=UPI0014122B5C|nr:HAMP domain-containing protein [Kineococcus vitellinus]